MKEAFLTGKCYILTLEPESFERLRDYSAAYDVKFPKVEVLISELTGDNEKKYQFYHYGFEGKEDRFLAYSSGPYKYDEASEEMLKSIIYINEDYFPYQPIESYLKEKRKM